MTGDCLIEPFAIHTHHLLIPGDDACLDKSLPIGGLQHAVYMDPARVQQIEEAMTVSILADKTHDSDISRQNSFRFRATLAAPPGKYDSDVT